MIQLSQLYNNIEMHEALKILILRWIGIVVGLQMFLIFQKAFQACPFRTLISVALDSIIDPRYLKFSTH